MAIYDVPSINLMGAGCLNDLVATVKDLGIEYEVYSELVPNPTCKNVHDGLDRLKGTDCDFLVSICGGSPQDTAKAIGILVINGRNIKKYEGVNISKNKSLPIVTVNTTAGTSSEVIIFDYLPRAVENWHDIEARADSSCSISRWNCI